MNDIRDSFCINTACFQLNNLTKMHDNTKIKFVPQMSVISNIKNSEMLYLFL